jgi:hypothetical protein
MRNSRNDLGLWLQQARNVMFGAPKLAIFALDWGIRRHLAYRRIPSVALPNAAGVYWLDFNGEQAPNFESRVLLSDETDRYRASELDWLTLSRMLRELRRAVEACRCGTVEYDEERLDQDARGLWCQWVVIILARRGCRRDRAQAL